MGPHPHASAAALEDSLSSRGPLALTARGAPPPRARAAALEDSLSSRGPSGAIFMAGPSSPVSFCPLVITASSPPLQRYESVEPHMGTLVRITLYTASEEAAKRGFRSAFDRIANLDRILSDYNPDSELNAVTRTAVHQPVHVSKDLSVVLAASQELAGATDGAFDVTQGPVIRLWRARARPVRIPDRAALTEAESRSGFESCTWTDRRSLGIRKEPPLMSGRLERGMRRAKHWPCCTKLVFAARSSRSAGIRVRGCTAGAARLAD